MSIEVSVTHDAEEWNRLVDRSDRSTPFHRYEALDVMATHSDADLYPFVGYKGQEPVGLFPVFSVSKGPLNLAASPPPDLEISYLGPVPFATNGMKQRKSERRHRRFISGVFSDVSKKLDPAYTHIRSGTDYSDPRPFLWNEFDSTPRHTYHVDITPDTEDLFMSFSSDIRKNVRNADENHDYEIRAGDDTAVARIAHRVRERHEEQDVTYTVPASFAAELYRELPDGVVRTYLCHSDGTFLGGLITLEDDQRIYRWQSATDLESDIPASDLLDWEMMKSAANRGIESVDLVGANNRRLCGYKAKFNPEVRTYYSLERSSLFVDVLKSVYLRLR